MKEAEKMKEMGYKIAKTCAICKHSSLDISPHQRRFWGFCELNFYQNDDDSPKRKMPAHFVMTCSNFELSSFEVKAIGLQDYIDEPWNKED